MVLLLLFPPLLFLSFILFFGDYTPLIFSFMTVSAILPPIIFKYRHYPHRSIYAFLVLWITFPKFIRFLPFIGTYKLTGISYFDILQTLAVLHIVVLLLMKAYGSKKRIIMPNSLRVLTNLFFGTVLFTTIAGMIRYYFFYLNLPYNIEQGILFENLINPFFGIIVLLGLCAFIVNYKQVEGLLAILAISGIILILENIIMVYLGLFEFLHFWSYASDNARYGSLIFSNYDLMSIFCVVSTIAVLYFVVKKRMYYLLPLVFLMILPIQMTHQRTAVLGFFIGILAFVSFYVLRRKSIIKFVALYLLFSSIILFIINAKGIYEKANIVIGGDVRKTELLDKSSLNSRTGIWLRSADVFIYSFPFGVAENMSPLYYNSSFVPTIANQLISQQLPDSYWGLVYSNYTTKAHNVFFHFVTEYNILGFLLLILFIKQIFKNFSRGGLDIGTINNALFRATVFSMIMAVGIMGLFESGDRLYFLYSMLLFFSYLNPSSMIEINSQKKIQCLELY